MIQIIDPTRYPGWDDLVLQHPEATILSLLGLGPGALRVLRYTPVYFACFRWGKLSRPAALYGGEEPLTGTRGVSLPFTDYCDPITDPRISLKDLLDRVIDFGKNRNWKYIELRGGSFLTPSALRLAPDASRVLSPQSSVLFFS